MKPLVLFITLCLALISCDSDLGGDPVGEPPFKSIQALAWFPGDSLIGAIMHSYPNFDSATFRIYDIAGRVLSEMRLPAFYTYPTSFYISTDGRHIVYSHLSTVFDLDIQLKTVTPILNNARIVSRAPESDLYIIDHTQYNGDPCFLATISNGTVFVRTHLPGESEQAYFPLLLTQDRIANLERDTNFSMIFTIRDLDLNVTERFFMPRSQFFMKIVVPANHEDFFFTDFTSLGLRVLKFRTDIGVMDLIREIDGAEFAITRNGDRLIFQADEHGIMRDIEREAETPILDMKRATTFSLSSDDKRIVYATAESNKIRIVTLP